MSKDFRGPGRPFMKGIYIFLENMWKANESGIWGEIFKSIFRLKKSDVFTRISEAQTSFFENASGIWRAIFKSIFRSKKSDILTRFFKVSPRPRRLVFFEKILRCRFPKGFIGQGIGNFLNRFSKDFLGQVVWVFSKDFSKDFF